MLHFSYPGFILVLGKQVIVVEKVGILYHPLIKRAYPLAKELQDFLVSNEVSVWLCSAWESEQARQQVDGTDLVLSVGGDGTILRAAQAVFPAPVPITGVNLGKLGFMTELSADEAKDKLPALLSGEGWFDERSLLTAELALGGRVFHALNDIVVARGSIARVIQVEVTINGELLNSYRADGVIVATATGSTGYSLAAGGPILYQQSRDFLLVPVLPHLNPAYPLVLSPAAEVKLVVSTTHEATLCIDGHINLPLTSGAVITVKHSHDTARFLRIHPADSFYSSLEQKLKGNKRFENR